MKQIPEMKASGLSDAALRRYSSCIIDDTIRHCPDQSALGYYRCVEKVDDSAASERIWQKCQETLAEPAAVQASQRK